MSDRRHSTRPTLPEGYQYGDAAPPLDPNAPYEVFDVVHRCFCLIDPKRKTVTRGDVWPSLPTTHRWRAPHENAAEQLKRQADGFDIAGDVTREDRIQRTGDETV